MRRMTCFVLFATLLISAGCGGSGNALGEVSGTVTYNGEPVESGKVIFEVPGARPASGKIVNGQITEVTTFEPGDGAPVGPAKIAVFATSTSTPATPAAPVSPDQSTGLGADYMGGAASSTIPVKYNDPATSELTWEIKSGPNQVELALADD